MGPASCHIVSRTGSFFMLSTQEIPRIVLQYLFCNFWILFCNFIVDIPDLQTYRKTVFLFVVVLFQFINKFYYSVQESLSLIIKMKCYNIIIFLNIDIKLIESFVSIKNAFNFCINLHTISGRCFIQVLHQINKFLLFSSQSIYDIRKSKHCNLANHDADCILGCHL